MEMETQILAIRDFKNNVSKLINAHVQVDNPIQVANEYLDLIELCLNI